jgi:hypothetical protein
MDNHINGNQGHYSGHNCRQYRLDLIVAFSFLDFGQDHTRTIIFFSQNPSVLHMAVTPQIIDIEMRKAPFIPRIKSSWDGVS